MVITSVTGWRLISYSLWNGGFSMPFRVTWTNHLLLSLLVFHFDLRFAAIFPLICALIFLPLLYTHFSVNLSTQRSSYNPGLSTCLLCKDCGLNTTENKPKGKIYTYIIYNIHLINQYFLSLLCARGFASTFMILQGKHLKAYLFCTPKQNQQKLLD